MALSSEIRPVPDGNPKILGPPFTPIHLAS